MSVESKYIHATRFAQYLRRNGSKVIDGSCKLSLTTSALCLLNTLFVEVLSEDWPESLNVPNAGDITADIKYLYDFMKKTSLLKLFHTGQTLRGGVDLSQFSSLTVLELRKIPFHLIVGLDCLSVQLKAIICSRSIYLLKEIFGIHGSEDTAITVWPELKELNLSYNYLECLDKSLRNLPNVELFDLSHNHLKNAEEIQVLKNLSFVNLNYNELEHLPVFNISSCRSLTKLYVRNNVLEDLDGVDCLFNLEELDVGYNLLSEYHVLSPLDKLKALKLLNLEGNPLFFHKQHPQMVGRFLNPYCLSRGFQLNGQFLTTSQMLSMNNSDHERTRTSSHQISINTVVGDAESLNSIPRPESHFARNISEVSEASSLDGNSVSSVASLSGAEQIAVGAKKSRKKKSKTQKKLLKHREVLINDDQNSEVQSKENKEAVIPSHVKAKEIMEARRRERGEAWLIPDNSYQQLAKPIPQVPVNTPMSNIPSPQMMLEKDIVSKIHTALDIRVASSPGGSSEVLSSTPVMKEMADIAANISADSIQVHQTEQLLVENDDIEVLNSNCAVEEDFDTNLHLVSSKEDLSDCNIYETDGGFYDNYVIEQAESEEECEDCIFFVTRLEEFKKYAVSVAVGSNYIKEKDVITACVIDRLDLNILQAVSVACQEKDGGTCCEVHLEFDTVNSSRQKRIYICDTMKEANDMLKMLQPFADAKTLREVTLGALECMKCRSQFSKQGAHKILLKTKRPTDGVNISSSYDSSKEYLQEVDACPNCGNHILVELESIPMPSIAMPPIADDIGLQKGSNRSPDTLSVGSGSSGKLLANILSSIKLSPILKRKTSLPTQNSQNQDLNASKTERKISVTDSTMSRNSSDITIISNPSQSSIAVIPEPDMNLNTITERDSQSSISPPSSQGLYYKTYITPESQSHSDSANTVTSPSKLNLTDNIANKDFHSPLESEESDVRSGVSDPYKSPLRSPSKSSIGIKESSEVDEVSQMLSLLVEERSISYDTFTDIDHRLKLHLEISVFSNNEQLEFCLQTSIVPLSTGEEFTGLFAISTTKLYVIKFLPLYSLSLSQNEPMEKGIQILHSSPLSHLKQVKVILGNQGLTLACGSSYAFTLVIREADICNSFSSLLSDFLQERLKDSYKVAFLTSTTEALYWLKKSVFALNDDSVKTPEVLLHLFAFWREDLDEGTDSFIPVCVVVTAEAVFISKILYKKQDSSPDLRTLNVFHYSLVEQQKLMDLLSVKLMNDLKSTELSFLNETTGQEVFWTLRMESRSALFSFVSAIRTPWEDIFGVPLSLAREED